MSDTKNFNKALETGRPPGVAKLFPNSKALIVSGKFIDRAMIKKGTAMALAANGRSNFVIFHLVLLFQYYNITFLLPIFWW